MDSLNNRIETLRQRLPKLKQTREPSLYTTKRELDFTVFAKAYEEFILDEELETAKSLVEKRIANSKIRRDEVSIDFYTRYKEKINKEIKLQKIRYQEMFAKEKYFRKEFNKHMKGSDIESYKKAKRITELAIKYAREKRFSQSMQFLNKYLGFVDARIFDLESPYDLEKLTYSEKNFKKFFIPLIASDSLQSIKEAGIIVDNCYKYAGNSRSILDTNYFSKQQKVVVTALSDYFDKEKRNAMIATITDKEITVRFDTLNQSGIYKWRDYIIVIGTIIPQSTFSNVRRGEAILNADRKLINYINDNKLGRIKDGDKFGHTFIIPYISGKSKKDFYHDSDQGIWQYMVCYTKILNSTYTKGLIKYLPPMKFLPDDIRLTSLY